MKEGKFNTLIAKGVYGECIFPEARRISYLALIRSSMTTFITSLIPSVSDLDNIIKIENYMLIYALTL